MAEATYLMFANQKFIAWSFTAEMRRVDPADGTISRAAPKTIQVEGYTPLFVNQLYGYMVTWYINEIEDGFDYEKLTADGYQPFLVSINFV